MASLEFQYVTRKVEFRRIHVIELRHSVNQKFTLSKNMYPNVKFMNLKSLK